MGQPNTPHNLRSFNNRNTAVGLLIALACVTSTAARAQDGASAAQQSEKQKPPIQIGTHSGSTVVFYDEGLVFTLTAPAGWTIDDARGRAMGIMALGYRNDAPNAVAVYVTAIPKTHGFADAMPKVAGRDIAAAKQTEEKATAKQIFKGFVKGKRPFITVEFHSSDQKAAPQRNVYVDTPKAVVRLAFTARSPADYAKYKDEFTKLVETFAFLTDNVSVHEGTLKRM